MQRPSILRRFAALFIDWMVASLSAALLAGTSFAGEDGTPAWIPLLVFWFEVTILVGLLGFSIGKGAMGIRVVGPEGTPPGLWRSFLRTGLVVLVVPALLQGADGRGLHEIASGTNSELMRQT